MQLRLLEATFLKLLDKGSFQELGDQRVGADGVMFLCPKCFQENLSKKGDGSLGTHSVICWFTGVPREVSPGPGRWNPSGTSLDDLTFVPPGAVSVLLTSGCGWHGFIRAGAAT